MRQESGVALAERVARDEEPMEPRSRNLLIALVAAALLIPFLFFQPFRLIEARLFDIMSILAPLRPVQPGAVIVAIDEPSFSEIGQRWPWPRDLHARLIDKLRAAGAKVVAVDIIFSEPSTLEADAALAAAVGPDVVLAADDVVTDMEQGVQTTRVGPLEPLLQAGARPGVTSVALEGDAYLRRLPTGPDGFAAEALRLAGLSPVTAPDRALIQYFGPPRTYPTVSYYQALDPDRFLPPGWFKDKIVLVGLSLKAPPSLDSGAADAFLTPYTLASESMTAGVEVQATILDNLRERLFILPVSRPAMAAIVLASALIGAALMVRGTSWRTGVVIVLSVGGIMVASWALLRYGRLWAPPALPAAALLAVFGARFGLDFARERHLRRAVSEAFSRYLSPDLVAELARNPKALKLGGERKNLTILFCDVRGFTSLSERLKDRPEQLTTLINRLLDALSGAVLAEKGTIDKYMGDCVMAFWNAPLPIPDHSVRAVRAALRMIAAVDDLNAALRTESEEAAPHFAVGVGINTGDCVVGNVGSRWRYDYSVLGDAVNLASRLEGLSKEYGVSIIVGQDTADAVRDDFVLIELDRIAVRGRATETAIFTVVAPGSARSRPDLAELQDLHPRLLAAARSGQSAAVSALSERCGALAPQLETFYAKLKARSSAEPNARAAS